MPNTKGQSGIEHFEESARVSEQTSNDGKFSTYTTTPGSGGDGPIVVQERGKPNDPAAVEPSVADKPSWFDKE